MIHELKTDSDMFNAVAVGSKRFEIRKNDRDFKKGENLILRETVYSAEEMAKGEPLEYTGNEINAYVLHILYGPIYGLADGRCIMSILPVGMEVK